MSSPPPYRTQGLDFSPKSPTSPKAKFPPFPTSVGGGRYLDPELLVNKEASELPEGVDPSQREVSIHSWRMENGGILRSNWGIFRLGLKKCNHLCQTRSFGGSSSSHQNLNISLTIISKYWKVVIEAFSVSLPFLLVKLIFGLFIVETNYIFSI